MMLTLTLTDAERDLLHALLKDEVAEVHHEIHKTEWKHRDELKERLRTVEGLLHKLDPGQAAKKP